jgi:hypothetical protein
MTLLDIARASAESHTHFTLILRPGDTPLSHSLVTPATSTLVQDNTSPPFLTGRRAFFGPNQYKSLVLAHHPDLQRVDTYYSLVSGTAVSYTDKFIRWIQGTTTMRK